jgi:hypothetical protein
MEETQLLRDENIKPTSEVIAESLDSANNAYIDFMKKLENHRIEFNWRYYNDGKAWLGKGVYKWTTLRGTQKETTAFWLSIWSGFFKLTIYIPEKYRTEALSLSLCNETKKMIEDAKQMGKLKFFPIVFDLCSNEMFEEIFSLIDFRKALK